MEHGPVDHESGSAQQLARLTRFLQYGGEGEGGEGGGLLGSSPSRGGEGGGGGLPVGTPSQAAALSSQNSLMDFVSADDFASFVHAQVVADEQAAAAAGHSQPTGVVGGGNQNHLGTARQQQQQQHNTSGALSPSMSLALAQAQQQAQQGSSSRPGRAGGGYQQLPSDSQSTLLSHHNMGDGLFTGMAPTPLQQPRAVVYTGRVQAPPISVLCEAPDCGALLEVNVPMARRTGSVCVRCGNCNKLLEVDFNEGGRPPPPLRMPPTMAAELPRASLPPITTTLPQPAVTHPRQQKAPSPVQQQPLPPVNTTVPPPAQPPAKASSKKSSPITSPRQSVPKVRASQKSNGPKAPPNTQRRQKGEEHSGAPGERVSKVIRGGVRKRDASGGMRGPSKYNMFIKKEIPRLKMANPEISHRAAFSIAAKNWRTCPANPAAQSDHGTHEEEHHVNGRDFSSTDTSMYKHELPLDPLEHDAVVDAALCESSGQLSADKTPASTEHLPADNGHDECPTPMSACVKEACELAAGVDLSELHD